MNNNSTCNTNTTNTTSATLTTAANPTNKMVCHAPGPYPEIKVSCPNLYFASLLMDDYAGVVSEFSAIGQYSYHNFMFKRTFPDVSQLERCISIVEMDHMDMLAETIILLGGNPLLKGTYSTGGDFWSGSYVNYGCQLCDQLKLDIDAEWDAIKQYSEHVCMISDPYVKKILLRIIKDEKFHICLFNKALYKHCGYKYRQLN